MDRVGNDDHGGSNRESPNHNPEVTVEHDELCEHVKSIEGSLKKIKKHHGIKDDPADAIEPDDDDDVEAVEDAPKKVSPRRRGRHAKGMPFFKKGDE